MTRTAGERILDLDLEQPQGWCDRAIELLLAATLLFTPAAFGTSEAWSQQIWFAAIAGLAVLMTVKLLTDHQSSLVWTWAYVPIVAYLGLVVLSLVPLPAAVLNVISPGTVAEKARLLADLPNGDALTSTTTISFNTWSTERGLRIVTAYSVIFVVAVNVFRTPQQIKRVLALIMVAGSAVAALALAQNLTADPTKPPVIYWTFTWPGRPPHHNSGPFVGHAQIGQYLNLTAGATLALILVLIGETFAGDELSLRDIKDRLGEPSLRLVYLLGVAMTAMAVANAWAASRGAMVGLVVATLVVTALILAKRGWRKGETPLVIGIVVGTITALAALVFFVFMPLIEKKFTTVESSGGARIEILKRVPVMAAKWPVMGTGLESFEWVYPDFQDQQSDASNAFFDHAENDYAQTLTDTGVVGVVVTLAFLAIVAGNWIRAYRGSLPIHLASIGIAFAMVAVMVQSAADFAQRTPAIGMLSALLCGLTISLSNLAGEPSRKDGTPRFGYSPLPRAAVGLVMVTALGWAMWSNHAVRQGEANYWVSDPDWQGGLKPTDHDYDGRLIAFFDERIAGCELAVQYDPKAVHYIHYLNEFRWRKLARHRDAKTLAPIYPDGAAAEAKAIVSELSQARALCPTFGPLYHLQGKIQWELLDKDLGRKLLMRGYDLKPTDPSTSFALVEVAAADGNWDEAGKWSAICLEHGGSGYARKLAELFVLRYGQAQRCFEMFGGNADSLSALAGVVPEQDVAVRQQVNGALIDALIAHVQTHPDDAPRFVQLADQLALASRKSEAVDALSKALALEFGNAEWRMSRARLLRDLGRRDEAISDAEMVLGMRPQSEEAKAIIKELKKKAP